MNQHFSLKRFTNLYRLWWFRNYKMSLIYMGALSGVAMFVTVWFVWTMTNEFQNFNGWKPKEYLPFYTFIFIALGVFYTGFSFPGFRSKEKTFEYLLLPSTTLEKFLFEWLNRVLGYLIFFPILFFILTNIATNGLSLFYPEFNDPTVDLFWLFRQVDNWEFGLIILVGITLLNIPFMGASHFQAKPLIKTLFLFFVIVAIYVSYVFGLVKLLNLESYDIKDDCVLFICSKEQMVRCIMFMGLLVNSIVMTISYLKLKEKEV